VRSWEDATRLHLTFTGYAACAPLCGCDKGAEIEAGARFAHAAWAPDWLMSDDRLCHACKAEFDSIMENEDDE